MSPSRPFILRPIATSLLMLAILLAGAVGFQQLPVSALPEVDYVVITAGSFDVLVEIVCQDDDDLLRLVNGSIRSMPGVRETETFVYLRLHKQLFTWGAR